MSAASQAWSGKAKAAVVMAIVLAGLVTVGAIMASTSYRIGPAVPGALSLTLGLNATTLVQNQALRVTVALHNGLPINNVLPFSDAWPVQNLSMGPCAFYTEYPYGIAVYAGTYTAANISAAKSMQIYAPGIYSCPAALFSKSFVLGPEQTVSAHVDLGGYWTQGETPQPGGFSQGVLHPFAQGYYTVVAGDVWGQLQIAYFEVSAG